MMGLTDYNLTPKAKKCIKDAKSFAQSKNHTLINVAHLTYACITNLSDSCAMKLKSYNVEFDNKKLSLLPDSDMAIASLVLQCMGVSLMTAYLFKIIRSKKKTTY